jgi:hypothetical protein
MFVAQTAFGRPAGFLFPSKTLVDRVFYPRGQLVKTKENPEEAYIVDLMSAFWGMFFYRLLGSAFAIGIVC